MDPKIERWLDESIEVHQRLTPMVAGLVEGLLASEGIEVLTVSHRTKRRSSVLEKIERKGYRDPAKQMTDVSGIRIVVYFESDVEKVANVIAGAFNVDSKNSRNRDALMSVNEIGYRSAHYVCDIGKTRAALPEFKGMAGCKFEFQVRTVLQHAWAELAHDRNYKLGGKLPHGMERQLYLYAGMLEIADKGFDELSRQIDSYKIQLSAGTTAQLMPELIDSINLSAFVQKWCEGNSFPLEAAIERDVPELVRELSAIGVNSIAELAGIIPADYSSRAAAIEYSTNIYGLVRDWMLIHDWDRLLSAIRINWSIGPDEEGSEMLMEYLGSQFYDMVSRMDYPQGDDD